MNNTNEIIASLKKIQESTELFAYNIEGELSLSQVHCIAVIGDIEDANVTKISNELAMTTGAITKMCKKLLRHSFVEKYQHAENNKEVYYKLTESGQRIYELHKQLHNKIYKDKESIINTYNEAEKTTILKFLNDINTAMNKTYIDASY